MTSALIQKVVGNIILPTITIVALEINKKKNKGINLPNFQFQPSVVGDCETSYYIETDVPKENDKYMYLTKVRNYLNCLERPFYTRSIYNAMRCAQCESEKVSLFVY